LLQALNLCSKRHALDPTSRFVICDAIPAAAAAFSRDLKERVAGVEVQVVSNPAQYVSTLNEALYISLICFSCFRVIEASATLITMLPSSPQVIEVYTSSDGILSGLSRLGKDAGQTLCIDSTTLDVEVARKVAKDVTSTGAEMVDAPVSGGELRTGCSARHPKTDTSMK
jgi:3-hydroxyisobutyrate dehydrogenase